MRAALIRSQISKCQLYLNAYYWKGKMHPVGNFFFLKKSRIGKHKSETLYFIII